MLLQITDATVSLGGKTILNHLDFEVKGSEKIALVGSNGAGKTTLLRLIAGELEPDADDHRQEPAVRTSRKLTVGMLKQNDPSFADRTVEEILLSFCPAQDRFSRERYLYEMEYDRLLTGFGFSKEDKRKRLKEFSGGEQTRISLIHLLLMKPDLLLLDEPTNHLDIAAAEWLEAYLKNYGGAVIAVSHDRFFLDQVADIVWELEDGRLTRYPGSYTDYRTEKRRRIAQQTRAWEQQQKEIARLNELVEKFKHKPNKAAFARSRLSMLRRMEMIEKPREDDVHIFTGSLEPAFPGSKWVMEAEHLKIGYPQTGVLQEIALRIRRGQKIGIIGENGTGKTTFIKTAAGLIEPISGDLAIGNQTVMGYFDQMTAQIASEKQVVEHFRDLYPAMPEKELRQTLGAWLFGGKEASKKVAELSGGEKSRLVLAEILTGRPNLLILDEPTNHMDIPARETLESALSAYTGTILFVSHDRYFVEKVADSVLVFEKNRVLYYPFGYSHYLEHVKRAAEGSVSAAVTAENQALIAGLKAVPKGESRYPKEISTESAYVDWRLHLEKEPLAAAEEAYGRLADAYAAEEEARKFADMEAVAGPADPAPAETGLQDLARQLAEAEERYTQACLKWYDIFLELGL